MVLITTWCSSILPAFVLFSGMFRPSLQSADDGNPINITLLSIDVEVKEREDRMVKLGPTPLVICQDNDDRDPCRVEIVSLNPNSPCSTECFLLRPCEAVGEFCLWFVPGKGDLIYNSASQYTMTVGCTDDVEPMVTNTITVKVVSNTPPEFIPNSLNTISHTVSGSATPGNTVVYKVMAQDNVDDDPIFYTMTTNPFTPYLTMGYSNGEIYATNNLLFLCEPSVEAKVSITDNYNPPVGPLPIEITISPHNTAPSVTNLDTTVSYKENTGPDYTVHTLDVVDDGLGGRVMVNMRTTSHSGLDMYRLDRYKIKTRVNANYERTDTRSIVLYFDLTDGYCNSKTYTLTINILDVDEPPVFHPPELQDYVVYEGEFSLDLLGVWDEDINDVFTYSKADGGSPQLSVDSATGAITGDIDIDPDTVFKKFSETVHVEDSRTLTDEAFVSVLVYDKNDNKPYFLNQAYVFGSHPCMTLGSTLGLVKGDDRDSKFQNNDAIHFTGGGGRMAVTATGQVVLTHHCVIGQTTFGEANIHDHGEYPGPLSGKSATLTLTCGPCPPPPAPAPPVTTTTATTTPANTTTANITITVSDDPVGILPWLIPAIILGILWLALTIYFCLRYCWNRCKRCCTPKPKLSKVTPTQPKQQPVKAKTPPPKTVTKKPPAKIKEPLPPVPIPPKPPTPVPYTFGFNQKNFTNQDILGEAPPDAKAGKPVAVENMPENVVWGNELPPENLRLGNPQGSQLRHQAQLEAEAAKNPPPKPAKTPAENPSKKS